MSQLNISTGKCSKDDASTSASTVSALSSSTDLASFFQCPVCLDYALPPILQCQIGHLICGDCRPKLTSCPICRGLLSEMRNLAMENVASIVMFPCKYSTNGCAVSLLHTEKPHHEDACEFRPYTCPYLGASCEWQGSLEQVIAHLELRHKSINYSQGPDIVFPVADINQPGIVYWVRVQSCFGHHFMLVLKKYGGHPQQFLATVHLIGSREQAENFTYRLQLNGHRRQLTWKATPRSIHESISSAILKSDCLIFDMSIAQQFAVNGHLDINVNISF